MELSRIDERLASLRQEHGRAAIAGAIERTLQAIGAWLDQTGSSLDELTVPQDWRTQFTDTADREPFAEPEQLAERIAKETGLREGLALELMQTIVQRLAAASPADRLEAIRARLPEVWASLFRLPPSQSAPPPTQSVGATPSPAATDTTGTRETLASGRVGSHTPVSSSRPMAQSRSVAENDDPRGDVKLASAEGTRRDQRGDTLARGHRGSNNPLSEGKE